MKKFLAIALALMLALCVFAGCGGGEEATTEENKTETENTEETKSDINIGRLVDDLFSYILKT